MRRIEILRKARKLLRKGLAPGICVAILHVLRMEGSKHEVYDIEEVYKMFPLLTNENAQKFPDLFVSFVSTWGVFWWEPYKFGLFSGRRRFMRWLIKQYYADKTELKI